MQETFKRYLSLEKGLSTNTIEAYLSDINDFEIFLAEKDCDLPQVDKKFIFNYLENCQLRGLGERTLSRRLVTLKIFFRFLFQQAQILKNPCENLEAGKLSKLLPDYLSVEEIDQLLNIYNEDKPLEYRNKFIIELLYSCGLRISELCGLRSDAFNFESGFLRVKGKGSKERSVPFSIHIQKMVSHYLAHIRPHLVKKNNPPELIVSQNGNALTRARVWQFLKEAAISVGIKKNIHPHTLRHSFASHLLANDADLRVIQELLGHADIATTQVYTHVEKSRLQNIHKNFFPRG